MKLFPARHILAAALTSGLVLASAVGSQAADWPSGPVKVISPFPPGTAADATARVVMDRVGQELGQAFVVESRGGAGGAIGAGVVAKAEPDGNTLLVSSSSMSSQAVFHRSLPYDEMRDFVHVAIFGSQPNVLVVRPGSPYKTVADLVAAAKAQPGTLTFASAGVGSASHMAGEKFRVAAKIAVRHVPFRGAEGLTEVMAGRIDFYFLPIAAAVGMLDSGKVQPLAVSTTERAKLLPKIPSMAEVGYPGAEYVFWTGLDAPTGTPPAIVAKLHDAVNKALADPAVVEKLEKIGTTAQPMTQPQATEFVAADLKAAKALAAEAGFVPED